jgi:shikimate dehydrogenase
MKQTLDLGTGLLEFEGGSRTRVFLLLGHPVAHSASPRLHTAALRAAGVDAVYHAFDVEPSGLAPTMRAIRTAACAGRVAGFNVTVPHKLAVLAEIDDLDPVARLAGAANTIVLATSREGVELHGANTDAGGLRSALADLGAKLAGARVLILGTGGMARAAIATALADGAAEIRVAGRDLGGAQEMLDEIASRWLHRLPHLACVAFDDAADCLPRTDILVQATTLGLGSTDPQPVSLEAAAASLVVLDAVYATAGTLLVRDAQARGLRAGDGRGLLVHQGAAAFALWTGLPAPLETMQRAFGI